MLTLRDSSVKIAKNMQTWPFDVYTKYQPFRASGEAAGHAHLTQLLHAQEGRIGLLARRWTRDALSGHARGVRATQTLRTLARDAGSGAEASPRGPTPPGRSRRGGCLTCSRQSTAGSVSLVHRGTCDAILEARERSA